MIVFDLNCSGGHRFEGWFGSSRDFAAQSRSGLIACPKCGSQDIDKAPMAPAVPRKGGALVRSEAPVGAGAPPGPGAPAGSEASAAGDLAPRLTPALARVVAKVAAAQAEALRHSRWVGGDFAETTRAMHCGEREAEPVHGRADSEEARSLIEEGIAVVPLLIPFAPPEETN